MLATVSIRVTKGPKRVHIGFPLEVLKGSIVHFIFHSLFHLVLRCCGNIPL